MEEVFQPFHTPSGRPIRRGSLVANWEDLLKAVGAGQAVIATAAEAAHFYPWPNLVYVPVLDAPPARWTLAEAHHGIRTMHTAMAASAPHGELRTLPNSTHQYPHLQDAARIVQAIRDIIATF